MKRKISKGNYGIIQSELDYFTDKKYISEDDKKLMLEEYEVHSKINFIRVILIIGAVLIGLGILSFIASNWQAINEVGKILVIFTSLGISFLISFRTYEKYEKTSKAMLYLGLFIYGAGIFLIGQIFNISGDYIEAFFFWSFGAMIISYIFKDKFLYVLSIILLLIFINGNLSENILTQGLLLCVMGVYIESYIGRNKLTIFIRNLMLLNMLLSITTLIELKGLYTVIIYFVIGATMIYFKQKNFNIIYKIQGNIIVGISGLILSFENIWDTALSYETSEIISVIAGVVFFIYLLGQVRKQSIISLVFTCILVFRYYFDTLYSFMPKFLFFIIAGLLLIGFGFYFEKMRKNLGGIENEKHIS